MSEERFEDILESCLRMVQAGVSIDDCVARHPEHATGLREQLAAARVLAGRMPVRPEPAAVARSRAQLLGAVAQQREAASGQEPSFPLRALRRLVVVPYALPAVLALLILGGAAMGVSATTGRGPVGGLFSSSSNTAETELEGIVTAVDCAAGTITIDDVTLLITEDTEFKDGLTCEEITPGMFVNVHARPDGNGGLIVREIEREEDACPADGTPTPAHDDACEDAAEAEPCPADGTPTPAHDDACEDAAEAEPCPADGTPTPAHDDDDACADEADDGEDNSGPGNTDDPGEDNSGPGNTDDPGEDNSGPGNTDDPGEDNSGPGNADDPDEDDSSPGNADDPDEDNSGPGGQEDHDDSDGGSGQSGSD